MGWTTEQQQAIDAEGMNIIVSAGAGSGKTAVLTARVQRILLTGIHVNQLLVLTFTNAAAAEMKERIRKTILKTPELVREKDLIDSAYITTFDSFALSIVKKYHAKLNITNQIQITDEVIIDMKKREILDEIFDEHYLSPQKKFMNLIHDFCLKDDKELKEYILNMYRKIELKCDKTKYLENYFLEEFSNQRVNVLLSEYVDLLLEKQKLLEEAIKSLELYFDGDFVEKVFNNFKGFLNAKTYDDFVLGCLYKSISVPRGTDDDAKKAKKKVFDIASSIKDLCVFSSVEEMKNEYLSTKNSVFCLVEILREFDKRLDVYKSLEEVFSFTDISRFAIQIVQENRDVRESLRTQFHEILVDEYQDTSDTQELFISLISKNNVYMVGDIKQSIYRFRNANPYLFKNKYDTYRDTNLGMKIDLLRNFRSREEVLDNINLLFDYVMDDHLGGADYKISHRMVFGNEMFIREGATNQNYNLDILTYDKEKLGRISLPEEEAFIIGNDIIEKMNSRFQVFDKDLKKLRDIEYKDFVILLEKSRDFDLYKKIFEYLHIPLSVLKEESLKKDEDILVIKNLFRFLLCLKEKRFDLEFRYTFASLCRSFLFSMPDSEIYDIYISNKYSETELYQKASSLLDSMDVMNISRYFLLVLDKFHYEEKLITIGRVHSFRVREEYLYQLCQSYESKGKTIYDFVPYLNQIFEEDYDLKFNVFHEDNNSCKIMTIHKSKGLEFPICYFAGFSSKFNMSELKEKILYDNQYGIILPKVEDSYKDTFLKTLLKIRTKREEISEKIRLLYVALTRAKEKMIFVLPKQEEEKEVFDVVSFSEREQYNSFLSIIKSIYSVLLPYVKESTIIGSKDYLSYLKKDSNTLTLKEDHLEVNELSIVNEEVEEKSFSKESFHLITKEEKEQMMFGTKVHEILEEIDFFDYNLENYSISSFVQDKIKAFLESDFIKKYSSCKFYKEYEFLMEEDDFSSHGIIDLLIEDKDSYIILDYKLKDISDENYDKQLNGYRDYIEKKTGKTAFCYLYSIFDEEYREVSRTRVVA